LIRHAGHRLALAVPPLPVAMVQPSFRTPLIVAVGATPLLAPGGGAAGGAAVALAAVAMLADPEHFVAFASKANPQTENRFPINRHACPWAGMDNGSQSWHARMSFDSWRPVEGCQAGTLPVATAGSPIRSRFRTQIYTLGKPI